MQIIKIAFQKEYYQGNQFEQNNIFITNLLRKSQYFQKLLKQRMLYFGDAELVQRHLHQDLNRIIKFVKTRQQQHLQLLQYNKSLTVKKRSIQSMMFINEEIIVHNQMLTRVNGISEEIKKQQDEIIEKYTDGCVKFQTVVKLMSRVVTRILQTNQQFIEKLKIYDDGLILYQQFIKMKSILTKLINQKDSIDLGLSTKTIIEYVRHKNIVQIERLKKLIKTLEDGEFQKIPYIYKGIKYPQQQKKSQQLIKAQTPKLQKQKPIQRKSPPQKKQQKPSPSISKLKNEIKQQQSIKKQKKQFATKLATMYSTLDISKKDFIQQVIVSNNPKQFDRIYGEMMLRNKFNQQQILQFQCKKDQFEEKVRQFKEMMLIESQRIQQVLMIRKPVKVEKRIGTQTASIEKIQPQFQQSSNKNSQNNIESTQSPTKQFRRQFVLRQKQGSPRFHKQAQYTQLRVTQQGFNHIKFDSSNQEIFLRSNRNRLPAISGNGGQGTNSNNVSSLNNVNNNSNVNMVQNTNNHQNINKHSVSIDTHNNSHLQQRYNNLSKSKDQKGHHHHQTNRKNFLMKNIELGVQNVIKQNQQKQMSENKSIAEKLKDIHPGGNATTSIGMNLMEFTFYGAKKKSYVLGQGKNSFVF